MDSTAPQLLAPAALLALLLGLSGCGDEDAGKIQQRTPTASASSSTAPTTPSPSEDSPADPGPGPSTSPSGRMQIEQPRSTGHPMPTEETRQTEAEPEQQCSGLSAQEAVLEHVGTLPPSGVDRPWDAGNIVDTAYDDCAELSAVVVGISMPTASSPYQIMLFHHGEYVGPATQKAYGFSPRVARLADGSVQATYRWPLRTESNAEASQSATSVFAWDPEEGKVSRSGNLPPDHL